MRKLALLVLIAVFASPLFSETPQQEIGAYAPFLAQNYNITNFTLENATAYAVISEGKVLAIFYSSGKNGLEPLSGEKEIESALSSYYLSSGYSPSLEESFSQAHEGISSLAPLRKPAEDKCRVLLGTDRFECTDSDSCQKACYSVTSFCLRFALGIGKEFVRSVLAFEQDADALDAEYGLEQEAYERFSLSPTQENADSYLSSIERLNKQASKAASSPLYRGYSFCFSPEYGLVEITDSQLLAQRAYANSLPFLTVKDETARVRAATLSAAEKMRAKALAEKRQEQKNSRASRLQNRTNFTSVRADVLLNAAQQQELAAKPLLQDPIILSSIALLLALGTIAFLSYRKMLPGKHSEK